MNPLHDAGNPAHPGGGATSLFPSSWCVELFDRLPSTHGLLVERMQADPRDRRVIVAVEQTDGRGRRGQQWSSPAGGLWFSFSLGSATPADPFLSLIIAAAARDALAQSVGPEGERRLRLKWPNDLVAGAAKLGGVLCTAEPRAHEDGVWLLFGVGLNLQVERSALREIERPATSVLAEFGRSPSPLVGLSRILSAVDRALAADRSAGRDETVRRLAPVVSTLGRRISWRAAGGQADREEELVGLAIALERDGGLRVKHARGNETVLRSGEVQHLMSLP